MMKIFCWILAFGSTLYAGYFYATGDPSTATFHLVIAVWADSTVGRMS